MNFTEKLSAKIKHSFFYCRPLALLSAAFLVSLFLFNLRLIYFLVFAAAMLIYCIYLLVCGYRVFKLKNILPYLLLFSVCLSVLISLPQIIARTRAEKYIGKTAEVKAVIESTYYSEAYGSMHRVILKEIEGKKVSGKAVLDLSVVLEFNQYDTVVLDTAIGSASETALGANTLSLLSDNVYLSLTSDTVKQVTDENKKGFLYRMHTVKEAMSDFLRDCLTSEAANYAIALFVGDTSDLPKTLKRDMSALGISHILAVSGMHTSMLAAMVGFLLDRTRSGRKTKAVIVSLAGLAFMCIAGLTPCVVRTVIMLILSVIPCFFGRRGDSITALMLSAVIICLISPSSVLSCSFLLSFFATLGLVLSAQYVSKRARGALYKSRSGEMKGLYKVFKPLVLATIVSASASAFTVPVIAMYFGQVSFISVAANFVAVPCSDYSMILLVAVFFTGKIPIIGKISVFLFEALYGFLVSFSEFMTKSFETTVSLRYPFFTVLLILFACIILFLRLRGIRNPASPLAAFLVCTVIFASCVQIHSASVSDRGEVIYTAIGSSEGLLVTSGEKSLYVDIGNGGKSLPVPTLAISETRYYQTKLGGYMFTHYHSAHIGTLKYLLSARYIEKLYLPTPETDSERSFYHSIVRIAEGQTEIISFVRGETVRFENAVIDTLPYTLLERSTHPTVAVKITLREKSLTFVGSSVMEAQSAFYVSKMLNGCKTVILGCHGPKNKESFKFLAPSDINVYLSPYETYDETNIFVGARFHYLLPDTGQMTVAVFKF